tara:strand:+ start:272 stop:472 length:201 start_codon:yes stop_codon:yes gene_type:complete
MSNYQRACLAYVDMNKSAQNKVVILEAFLEGLTPNDIIRKRLTNLSVSSVYQTYHAVKRYMEKEGQ